MSTEGAIGLLLDTFALLGIGIGILCLLVVLIIRAVDGQWKSTTALIEPVRGQLTAQWITDDGGMHSRALDHRETADLAGHEEATVYYNPRASDSMRLHKKSGAETVFRLLLLIMGGIGVACFIASTALALLAG